MDSNASAAHVSGVASPEGVPLLRPPTVCRTVAVARAAPDGYTLVACTVGTCAIVPSLVKNTGYDLAKDFVPVILFGGVANIFVVTPTFPPKSIKELVALARARPGEIVFGSGGVGNSPHMTVELLKYRTKIDMVHVPYKGSGPALIDTAGGQVQMMVENEPAIVAHIKSGRLRGLAGTGPRRSAALADIPTMLEQGYEDFVVEAWFGLMAPARTPRAAVDRVKCGIQHRAAESAHPQTAGGSQREHRRRPTGEIRCAYEDRGREMGERYQGE